MCVIIRKHANTHVDMSVLEAAYENNPDGFGLMYAYRGRVHVIKGMLSLNEIKAVWRKHRRKSLAAHFRYATRGARTEDNVHPFQILSVEENGIDLWMMHNGTITEFGKKGDKTGDSDTVMFANSLKADIQRGGIEMITDRTRRGALANRLGVKNKVLFMTGTGEVFILNRKEGLIVGDTWFSNAYSLDRNYRKNKKNNPQGTSYHYGRGTHAHGTYAGNSDEHGKNYSAHGRYASEWARTNITSTTATTTVTPTNATTTVINTTTSQSGLQQQNHWPVDEIDENVLTEDRKRDIYLSVKGYLDEFFAMVMTQTDVETTISDIMFDYGVMTEGKDRENQIESILAYFFIKMGMTPLTYVRNVEAEKL